MIPWIHVSGNRTAAAIAIEWDESFKNSADPSGRAVAGVHQDVYGGD